MTTESEHADQLDFAMIRPPVQRTMRVLDRSFFQTRIPLTAAAPADIKLFTHLRRQLGLETFKLQRLPAIHNIPDPIGGLRKGLLLRPEIRSDDPSTWTPRLTEMVNSAEVNLLKYDLTLDYDYWGAEQILESILPEDMTDDSPHSFNTVGHIAHLNLRPKYLPYKHLIAQVLLDKNSNIRTVINKTEAVGSDSPFRTFNFEVLAGSHDMNVETSESGCVFRFDYSKVYWNSKLREEHTRVIDMFQPGEAIADAMAGVGPFAVPAGKKRCFVWANDLNPDSYDSLKDAIQRNKVRQFVRPSNLGGGHFIQRATDLLWQSNHHRVTIPAKRVSGQRPGPPEVIVQPKLFSHYVMNLPATALDFLPAFWGIYSPNADLVASMDQVKMPLIHVYCFAMTTDGDEAAVENVCARISERLAYQIRPGHHDNQDEATVYDVRDVAPLKHMFRATFRLPPQVAFARKF